MIGASRSSRQSQAYALANAEFRLALSQVGVNLRKNGEWLVRFATKTPLFVEGEHTKDREDLYHELLCLGVLANRLGTDEVGRDLNEIERKMWRGATDFYRQPQGPHEYKEWWKSVLGIRGEVYMVLDALLRNGRMSLDLVDAVCDIDLQGHRVLHVPLNRLTYGDRETRASLKTAVLLRLAAVLEKHRLRRCDGCGALFFTHRSDQYYHARSCQMKTLMRRRRQAKRSAPHKKARKKSTKKGGKRGT